MYEEMIEAYERGESCAFISIDQSAAYELIDHEILIEKMKIIGADEDTIELMISYLENRQQYVEIETKSSQWMDNEQATNRLWTDRPQNTLLIIVPSQNFTLDI